MNKYIVIKVEVPDRSRPGEFKTLYSNRILVDENLSFPYSQVLSTMRFLYPQDGARFIVDSEL